MMLQVVPRYLIKFMANFFFFPRFVANVWRCICLRVDDDEFQSNCKPPTEINTHVRQRSKPTRLPSFSRCRQEMTSASPLSLWPWTTTRLNVPSNVDLSRSLQPQKSDSGRGEAGLSVWFLVISLRFSRLIAKWGAVRARRETRRPVGLPGGDQLVLWLSETANWRQTSSLAVMSYVYCLYLRLSALFFFSFGFLARRISYCNTREFGFKSNG